MIYIMLALLVLGDYVFTYREQVWDLIQNHILAQGDIF